MIFSASCFSGWWWLQHVVGCVLLALVFRMLNLWVSKLTGRGDGGSVGAQASGDARARRQAQELFCSAGFFS